jgi:ParB-like chromosome segregation protein Spo0J
MKYQIRYQTLKLADLVHPPYNPRVQIERDTPEYDALKRSLEQHELVEPLVVNLCNMHCVGGNQRLTVMRDMGVEEETCVVIEQPDELKEKELCLALNKIKGRWDTEKTGELLRDDAVLDFETGFDLDEVKSYRAIEEATATGGDGLDELEDDTEEPDTLDELEEAAEDELEDDTEEPEAYGTSAKIGQIKIKLTADEYDELLNSIRDDGIFAEKDISAEMKRRILKND